VTPLSDLGVAVMSSSALAAGVRQLRGKLALDGGNEDSDEQLLHDFQTRRDNSAFAALVRRHGPMVLGVCRRVLGHQQDAEDAFQATFLVLARNVASLRKGTALASWLHGIAYRTAMKAKQTAARRRKHESQTPPRPSVDPSGELLWREVRTLLDEEIARLPDVYRSVFLLCCLDGLSQARAGQRLGLKERTVSNRLAAARQRLSRRLARRGVELTALLAVAMLETTSATALPALLLLKTTRAALAPAGATFAQTGWTILPASKTKMAMVLFVIASLLGGVGLWARSAVAPPAPSPTARAEDKPKAAKLEIHGRVLDPVGKPKNGAKLLLLGKSDKPVDLGVSAADGRFKVTVPREAKNRYLLAQSDGLGIDFISLDSMKPGEEIELRLVKDHMIRGRIVNTEGKPVAGARVGVDNLGVYPNNSLDSFLAIWKKQQRVTSGLPNGVKHVWEGADKLFATTTDAEGRFVLHGLGAERLVSFLVRGAGIADAEVWVVNRHGFDPKPFNEAVVNNSSSPEIKAFGNRWLLHGSDSLIVAEAGKVLRGVVKDIDTGKGRPGVEVILSKDGDGNLLSGPLVKTRTDGQGRYEIRGARKGKSYQLEVASDPIAGYVRCQVRVADTAGYQPVVADIRVKRGVIVTGKVIDKSTGKPIPGWVRVGILHDNRFVKDYPRFDSSAWTYSPHTDDAGTFRVVTLPGPVLLMGGPDGRGLPREWMARLKYKPVVPDPQHPEYFSKKEQRNSLGVPFVFFGYRGIASLDGNFCKVLNVKPGSRLVEQNVTLEPGTALPIRIQDAEGGPLDQTLVTGMSSEDSEWPIACDSDSCSVYNLESGKRRSMVFFHPKRQLAGTLTLKGDEKELIAVELRHTGSILGRLLGADGKPLAGIVVDVRYRDRQAEEIHKVVHKAKQAFTDETGAFVLDGVIPELKFELSFRQGKRTFELETKPADTALQVKSGQTLKLGALKLKRVPEKEEE
jgi:RNA polymerase sigma factor (sigma-70 family)